MSRVITLPGWQAEAAEKHDPIYVANTEGTARGLIQPNLGGFWKEYGHA